ncbi:MAG: hypothetical protein HUU02_01560 [Bacteroidetes bacterium]|nr:hypothetical protein [Bacteroidota bacterium]
MIRRYRSMLIVFILMLMSAAAVVMATPEPTQYPKRCTVKLYSANGIVASWDAMGMGQVEGQTLTFTVGSEVSPRKVRISGTWSIEERD